MLHRALHGSSSVWGREESQGARWIMLCQREDLHTPPHPLPHHTQEPAAVINSASGSADLGGCKVMGRGLGGPGCRGPSQVDTNISNSTWKASWRHRRLGSTSVTQPWQGRSSQPTVLVKVTRRGPGL